MAQPNKGSQNEVLYKKHVAALMAGLDGTPILDKEGQPIFHDGKLLMMPASAGVLKAVNDFLKQGGIDEEPSEKSEVGNLAEKLRKFDDSPLYIPERDEARAS